MTTRRRFPKYSKVLRLRNLTPHRARGLDDSASDEVLDDWMAACPAADPVPSD
jgi:hypothetical protein